MTPPDESDPAYRVLVLVPTDRDAGNTARLLATAGVASAACRDVAEVCREMGAGVGAVLLTEEAFVLDKEGCLAAELFAQPRWSDVPVIVLTRGGPESPAAARAMKTLGNIVLLERPVRMFTLVTAAQTALRARAKQYEVRDHLAALAEADRRKDEFLATLAHELRNPLAPIRNALEIMTLVDGLPPPLRRARDVVERQVGQLVLLVNDLLDVSRISRGKIELRRERVDLRAVARVAVETSLPAVAAGRHELTEEASSEPVWVFGDEARLAQVVVNLLNNAAKYTNPGGRVRLSVGREGGEAVVAVRDSGIGIRGVDLPRIFDLFTQVGENGSRLAQGGLGIGLGLVKRLVEMHGGTVEARSEGLGRGSEFVVRLPLADGKT